MQEELQHPGDPGHPSVLSREVTAPLRSLLLGLELYSPVTLKFRENILTTFSEHKTGRWGNCWQKNFKLAERQTIRVAMKENQL